MDGVRSLQGTGHISGDNISTTFPTSIIDPRHQKFVSEQEISTPNSPNYQC